MAQQGTLYDIQRYSINDGPGIRTTVFLKGCPLSCLWCDNPESQKSSPQLFFFASLCTRCYRCQQTCTNDTTAVDTYGAVGIDRGRCQVCGECTRVCPSGARVITGKTMTVDEVMAIIREDTLFYRNSGGGVTASGGEPTSQPEFLAALFRRCHDYSIDTALDTCGHVSWQILEPILKDTDLVLFDLKHMDPVRHRELTGVSNELILDNARRIARKGPPMTIRVPLIPGCNDSVENIRAMGEFLRELGLIKINLLPYHQLGKNKYQRLGLEYKLDTAKPYQDSQLQPIREMLESYQLEILFG
ncbi:glycyl-radical enzyme activating protein [Chloroflexota bacterium]